MRLSPIINMVGRVANDPAESYQKGSYNLLLLYIHDEKSARVLPVIALPDKLDVLGHLHQGNIVNVYLKIDATGTGGLITVLEAMAIHLVQADDLDIHSLSDLIQEFPILPGNYDNGKFVHSHANLNRIGSMPSAEVTRLMDDTKDWLFKAKTSSRILAFYKGLFSGKTLGQAVYRQRSAYDDKPVSHGIASERPATPIPASSDVSDRASSAAVASGPSADYEHSAMVSSITRSVANSMASGGYRNRRAAKTSGHGRSGNQPSRASKPSHYGKPRPNPNDETTAGGMQLHISGN